jgi:hypothetical protein
MKRSEALKIRANLETAVQSLPDASALEVRTFYPVWESGKAYAVGYKVQYNDRLYRVVQAHTSQEGWNPEAAPALWESIEETHNGTLDDPKPYSGNMTLDEGVYYMQDGEIYYCKYGSGIPVYEHLAALTTFVEKV